MTHSRPLLQLLISLSITLMIVAFLPAGLLPPLIKPMLGGACLAALFALIIARPKTIIEPVHTTEYLLGTPEPVTVYESYRDGECYVNRAGYYSSYERAFNTHPDFAVRPIKLYKVGDKYIQDISVRLVDIQVDRDVKETPALTADTQRMPV